MAADQNFVHASDVRELGRTVRLFVAESRSCRVRFGGQPSAESIAVRELWYEEAHWGGGGLLPQVWARLGLLMAWAEDHLLSTVALAVGSPPSVVAHVSTARAALESAAIARWLGETVPNDTGALAGAASAQVRVARFLALRYESNSFARQASQTDEQRRLHSEVGSQLDQAVVNAGLARRSHKRSPPDAGVRVPNLTMLIDLLFGSSVGLSDGAQLYRIFSAVAHAHEHGLAEFAIAADGTPSSPHVTAGRLVTSISAASLGYWSVVVGVHEMMGWRYPKELAGALHETVNRLAESARLSWPPTLLV